MTTRTYTRTHVYVSFANPHLVCQLCRQPVARWHNNDKCGCEQECWLDPCSHNAEAVSVCPSWSPVDGCTCREALGTVDHSPPPCQSPTCDLRLSACVCGSPFGDGEGAPR